MNPSDRWLVVVLAFLTVSVLVTGGLAVYLTVFRDRGTAAAAPTLCAFPIGRRWTTSSDVGAFD